VVSGLVTVTATQPYYRSTYVFVSRKASALAHLTLDDPRLRRHLLGVQMIGNDATNTPPAHAISSRGIIDTVRGYMLVGDYGRPNPAATIIDAVSRGDVDVALVWGPPAGYFAKTSAVPLTIEPITPAGDSRWPMAFDISMAVRRGDLELRDRLNAALRREKAGVNTILRGYGVPLSASRASPVIP
jgi:mxaJ protein